MKTRKGDEWICLACWETNSKPETYYARSGRTEDGMGEEAA